MGLKCGIVGLPNVGKSTLFNCLSNAEAQSANFPFCTIEPNVGTISVPDNRLNKLAELVQPQNVLPTNIEIYDIAGLVKGASQGEGLGNQFLANIRETDAIIHVLRCFDDENIAHVDGSVDPVRDKETIDYELQLKDLEAVDKKIDRLANVAKSGDKDAMKGLETLKVYKTHLESGQSARSVPVEEDSKEVVQDIHLLTDKPVLYVCNVDEKSVKTGNEYTRALEDAVRDEDAEVLYISAAIEAEIAQLDDPEERKLFLEDMGLEEPGVNKLINAAYKLLDLETYFTAGEKEVRAWTIKRGTRAPKAAAEIHTDFEKGFIKAEIISYKDYEELGSEQACREAGKLRMEGKDYIVRDGDVIHFKFNV